MIKIRNNNVSHVGIGEVIDFDSNNYDSVTFSMRSDYDLLDGAVVSIIRISDYCSVIHILDFDEYFLLTDQTSQDFRVFLNRFTPNLPINDFLNFVLESLVKFKDYLPDLSPNVKVYSNE